jgi:hypothetical protein
MRQLLLIIFGSIVIVFLAIRELLDLAASIEYAEESFPWIKRFSEGKKWQRLLLLVTLLFYAGTLYEMIKEPEGTIDAKIPSPLAPTISIKKVVIKTTGSGRLDRDLSDQQSDHLYTKLKEYVDIPNRALPANVLIVTAYPCDRESMHISYKLRKLFNDAHWNVSTEMAWPPKTVDLGGRAKNELPIGIWLMTHDEYVRYSVWEALRESGLNSDNTAGQNGLPDNYKGLIVIVGYKDTPF